MLELARRRRTPVGRAGQLRVVCSRVRHLALSLAYLNRQQLFSLGRSHRVRCSDFSIGPPDAACEALPISNAMAGKIPSAMRRRRGSCKCLFGAPDREETRRLAAEQYARDRRRFLKRFDFDISSERPSKLGSPVKFSEEDVTYSPPAFVDLGNTELCNPMLGSPRRNGEPRSPRTPHTPRTPRTPRAAKTPRTPRTPNSRRQLHMTDYWTIRKSTDSSTSDKEN